MVIIGGAQANARGKRLRRHKAIDNGKQLMLPFYDEAIAVAQALRVENEGLRAEVEELRKLLAALRQGPLVVAASEVAPSEIAENSKSFELVEVTTPSELAESLELPELVDVTAPSELVDESAPSELADASVQPPTPEPPLALELPKSSYDILRSLASGSKLNSPRATESADEQGR